MPKWLPSSHGCFIENSHHAIYELVVELDNLDLDSTLFGPLCLFSRVGCYLFFPPVVEVLYGYRRKGF